MLHIFTFATDESKIIYLQKSAQNHNLKINYILKNTWNGYEDKILSILKVINNFQDNDIICFIDAYDVLCNGSEEEILSKFYEYNCSLLIGAELNCFPPIYIDLYSITNKETNYNYVNSGGYIGYKWAIKKMFEYDSIEKITEICKNGTDQAYVTEYYLKESNKESIKLDIYAKIFQNMHWVDWNELEIENKRVKNLVLKETPCFLHFNGGTWQTQNRDNIIPVILIKCDLSDNKILNLSDYNQIITQTCFPHPQKNT